MAGVKGPRPCLGLLGKGDWPLSTRANPHRDSHLLVYTCRHTCSAGHPRTRPRALLSLSLSPSPSLSCHSSRAVLRSQNPALSRYELCTRSYAPLARKNTACRLVAESRDRGPANRCLVCAPLKPERKHPFPRKKDSVSFADCVRARCAGIVDNIRSCK